MPPIALRLDEETRRRVNRIARRKGTTASQIIRDAIQALIDREEQSASAWDRMKHLIGVVEGTDPGLSSNTGRRFAEILKARRSQR